MFTTSGQNAPLHHVRTVNGLLHLDYTERELMSCDSSPDGARGFVTFFDPGWSILHLREAVAGKSIFPPLSWYDSEVFAKFEEEPRYRQLRKTEVTNSFQKTFAEQQALVPADVEIPLTRVVVMGMVIHFLATGTRLFSNYLVRCNDQDSHGGRVFVGDFGPGGFIIYNIWDELRCVGLGLASSLPPRKF